MEFPTRDAFHTADHTHRHCQWNEGHGTFVSLGGCIRRQCDEERIWYEGGHAHVAEQEAVQGGRGASATTPPSGVLTRRRTIVALCVSPSWLALTACSSPLFWRRVAWRDKASWAGTHQSLLLLRSLGGGRFGSAESLQLRLRMQNFRAQK